jgi:hypothetical protein
VESLEERLVLSTVPLNLPVPLAPAAVAPQHTVFRPAGGLAPESSPGPVGLQPAQVRHAYGFDLVQFGTVAGDGRGQTIALIDAYDDPTIANDLAQFDAAFGLPALPSFSKVAQNGSTLYPGVDPSGSWETEEALDVEWAHALAPAANILLVEANNSSFSNLNAAVDYARHQPGVSVVSMSYGGAEFSGEAGYDGLYTTPAGHAGVTFVAAAGDSGAPPIYPAASPNVVAVGGTTLSLGAANAYAGETGWSGSGGGISAYEAQPAYQQGVVTQTATQRGNPDVAFDANPASGVAVYNSYTYGSAAPWVKIGGTSFSAPAWGALLAVADQGRALSNAVPLDGAGGALPALYQLPATDFHDIVSGNNGYAAGPGYDLVTGRGSPVANLVVADLVQPSLPPPPPAPTPAPASHFSVTVSAPAVTAGAAFSVTVQALDSSGHVVAGYAGTVHFTSTDPRATLPADYTFTATDNGAHTFTGVILRTAGSRTVTAMDTTASVAGSATVTVDPAALNRFKLSAPVTSTAGRSFTVTVAAQDAYGNTVTGYAGTVHFRSSDRKAVLPGNYTFTAADRGVHTFTVTLRTPGTDSITVNDTVNTRITGAATVTVVTGPAPALAPSAGGKATPAVAPPPLAAGATDDTLREWVIWGWAGSGRKPQTGTGDWQG